MKEIIIREKSFDFAVRIINLYLFLKEKKKRIYSIESDLAIRYFDWCNIEEATGGVSKADFKNKLSIAYKEARETDYWLRLLKATSFINEKMFNSLEKDCTEIKKILYTIIKGIK